jgi:hypothetical protein
MSELLARVRSSVQVTLWRLAYELGEARESHAAHGRMLRSAWCCVGLAALKVVSR